MLIIIQLIAQKQKSALSSEALNHPALDLALCSPLLQLVKVIKAALLLHLL